jgi:hypothetical protein
MVLFYQVLFPTLWLIWGTYWWARSRSAKATARQESLFSRLSYIGPLLVAFALLWLPSLPIPVLRERFLPLAAWPFWAAAGCDAHRGGSRACNMGARLSGPKLERHHHHQTGS